MDLISYHIFMAMITTLRQKACDQLPYLTLKMAVFRIVKKITKKLYKFDHFIFESLENVGKLINEFWLQNSC